MIGRSASSLFGAGSGFRRMSRLIKSVLPKGLYARSLLIVIAPVVLLQSVIAYAFMDLNPRPSVTQWGVTFGKNL